MVKGQGLKVRIERLLIISQELYGLTGFPIHDHPKC